MQSNTQHIELLRFIQAYSSQHGRAPSHADIRQEFDCASGTVSYRLQGLCERGWLVAGGGARKMQITVAGCAALEDARQGALSALPAGRMFVVRSRDGVPFTMYLESTGKQEMRVITALVSAGLTVRKLGESGGAVT